MHTYQQQLSDDLGMVGVGIKRLHQAMLNMPDNGNEQLTKQTVPKRQSTHAHLSTAPL